MSERPAYRPPVKITINVLARVNDTLQDVCDATGENRTEVINKAIEFFGLYVKAAERGETMQFVTVDGKVREVYVL